MAQSMLAMTPSHPTPMALSLKVNIYSHTLIWIKIFFLLGYGHDPDPV